MRLTSVLFAHLSYTQLAQPLYWFSQRPPAPQHVRPQVTGDGDALTHCSQGERSRADLTSFQLFPRARRGPGRARLRSHGIGGGEGGAVAVASSINEDAPAAVSLAELLGQTFRIAPHEH